MVCLFLQEKMKTIVRQNKTNIDNYNNIPNFFDRFRRLLSNGFRQDEADFRG